MNRSLPEPAPPPANAASQRRWILAAAIVASTMGLIDIAGFNVTLPSIQSDLHASGSQVIWIVNAYGLFLSSLLLVGGSLGDRYGRKRVFSVGIALFAVASLMAGIAPTSLLLILARAVQGVGGALLVPGSLSIITAGIHEERGAAIGTWSAATTIMTVIGPVLAGFLANAGLWRGFFLINPPLALVALIILWKRVPETRDEEASGLDLLGTGLIILSLAGLSYGAVRASDSSLGDPVVIACLFVGVIALLAFLAQERANMHPLLPLDLFRSAAFAATNGVTLLLYGALSACFFFFPLVLIQAHGYLPRQAGFALLPFSILLALLSRASGRLSDRLGPRLPLTVGPILTGLGFLLLGHPQTISGPGQYWTTFLPGVGLAGVGMGITVAPLTSTVMGAVPTRQAGIASGVNNAVARTAGLLAIAIFGSLALVQFRGHLAQTVDSLPLSGSQRTALMATSDRLGDTAVPPGLDDPLGVQVKEGIQLSFVKTFTNVQVFCGSLAIVSGLIALIALQGSLWPFAKRQM